MTYNAREISLQDGRPIEFFEFIRGSQRLFYTSADRNVTTIAEDEDYIFVPGISRTEIESSQELARSAITVTMPRNTAVADAYRIQPPSVPFGLTVRQTHESDTGLTAILWSGRVVNVTFAGEKALVHCEPTFTMIRRLGLRRFYQRQCPHALYGPECGLNRATFMLTAAIDTITGAVLSISELSAQVNGFYAGGYVERDDGSAFERRFITAHTGADITLERLPPTSWIVGNNLQIYPGCDHTMDMCNSAKFNNALNFGGFRFFPSKNPFGGTPLF